MEKELNTYNCQVSPVIDQLPSPPPEAHYTVYRLTNPEGKIYIGCTGQTVEERWRKGWHYSCKTRIFKAIREFGWENFEKKILCEKLTREGAEKLEKWFIAYYDSANPEKGYNRALGGLGKGFRLSEATKEVCSRSKKQLYKEDPGYRARVSEGVLKAYENDPGYRVRVSEGIMKAYDNNPVLAGRISAARKMYLAQNPERREEISRQMKEYLSKPENRAFAESSGKPRPVFCVETRETYPSQLAAERETGFAGIHKACHGRQFTAGGYHWQFI